MGDVEKGKSEESPLLDKKTDEPIASWTGEVSNWWSDFIEKFKGQGEKPPSFVTDWRQPAVTFIGVASSLLIIAFLAASLGPKGNGSDWVLMLGSYGALATLLFAAPQAPFSQPRMVFGGHAVAIFIAYLFDFISEPAYGHAFISKEVAFGLAPAFAITIMMILGLTHPPAGAIVLVYLIEPLEIRQMGVFFYIPAYAGCIIMVLLAMLINNVFPFRPAYPRFW